MNPLTQADSTTPLDFKTLVNRHQYLLKARRRATAPRNNMDEKATKPLVNTTLRAIVLVIIFDV